MEVVFFVEKQNLSLVKDLIGESSNSLNKKVLTLVGKSDLGLEGDGGYLFIDVSSGATKKIADIVLKNLAEELSEKEKNEIKKKLEERQESLEEKSSPLKGNYAVYYVSEENLEKVKNIVGLGGDSLDRQSITIRDNVSLGLEKEGNYLVIEGSEKACKLARELLMDYAQELEGEEKEKVLSKIKEMEDAAMEGFGGIFG